METQWTADGRYLYYYDVEEEPADAAPDRPRTRSVGRIWDRVAGKPAGELKVRVPVGPG